MTIDKTGREGGGRSVRRDLERYAALFAERTQVMKSSAMRDMMAITERDDVISLAGGLPDTSTFPSSTFASVMERVAEDSARALQYGPTDGSAAVKRCIAEVMAAEGMHADPDEILVTTGGQQVIDLACKTLIDPGDVIVAEGPTYPGAVPTFSAYQADVVQIPMDSGGMRIDELEAALARLDDEGRRPKFIYTVPTFQNPAGVTMAEDRRRRLVEIANERELLVLEDNPYGLLRYEGDPPTPLYALDTDNQFVIYLGTFSKILSPGIRLGWTVAPPPVLDKMNLGKQAADLCTASLTQHFVAAYFEGGRWQDYVQSVSEIYRRRRDVMLDALAEHLPREAEWTYPQGGLFIWATLPDYIDTTDLLARALRENVAFVPGRGAYLDGRGGSEMRLNFSGVSEDDIREGVRRIGKVVREQVSLYGTLTGATPEPAATQRPAPRDADPELAEVLQLRRRRAR
jgi:2-aminoadipate transaminase